MIHNASVKAPLYSALKTRQEANIRNRGKTIHVVFKYLPISLLYKEMGEGGVIPLTTSPPPYFLYDPWMFHLKTT
jgi:hypothetical protein